MSQLNGKAALYLAKIDGEAAPPIAPPPIPWPRAPRPEVIAQGTLGAILALLEPQTDADMTGILMHVLVSVGNAIGRGRHICIGPARHYLNENLLVIGESLRGKKGSANRESLRIMRSAAPDWCEKHIKSGLSSGEGLIWQVRDPIEKQEPVKDRDGNVTGYQTVIGDPGVADKRLLIVMTEFSQVQKVMKREGNTLGEIIRNAWDGEKLAITTKTSPATATDAHISIIGHTTPAEFRRLLSSTDEVNGLLNRFMVVMVKSSRKLAFGGNVNEGKLAALAAQLRPAIEFGRQPYALTFADDFREPWTAAYEWLDDDRPGRLGPILARAPSHVMRLAGLYAVLECSEQIRARHLEAALALWHYVEESTAYVFGQHTGSRMAEKLSAIIEQHPEGIDMTGLHAATSRKLTSDDMRAALDELRKAGRAEMVREETAGPPRFLWYPAIARHASPDSLNSPNSPNSPRISA